jgi:hypothetical protein
MLESGIILFVTNRKNEPGRAIELKMVDFEKIRYNVFRHQLRKIPCPFLQKSA